MMSETLQDAVDTVVEIEEAQAEAVVEAQEAAVEAAQAAQEAVENAHELEIALAQREQQIERAAIEEVAETIDDYKERIQWLTSEIERLTIGQTILTKQIQDLIMSIQTRPEPSTPTTSSPSNEGAEDNLSQETPRETSSEMGSEEQLEQPPEKRKRHRPRY